MRKRTLLVSSVLASAVVTGPAHASLTLNLNFGNFDSTAPSGSVFGGGVPSAVVRAAADYWRTAFANSTVNVTQTLDVSWAPQPTGVLAQGGASFFANGTFAGGSLVFDNDGSSPFFVDPTPYSNAEWSTPNTSTLNLGGGNVNVQRRFTGGAGDAGLRNDMLSVAIHEIGHAIGVLGGDATNGPGYPRFDAARDADSNAADLDITSPRQFPGTQIPIEAAPDSTHSAISTTNLSTTLTTGQRKLLTEVDILLVAQVQNFDNVNLNPQPVPEPAVAGIAAAAGVGLLGRRRRRRVGVGG